VCIAPTILPNAEINNGIAIRPGSFYRLFTLFEKVHMNSLHRGMGICSSFELVIFFRNLTRFHSRASRTLLVGAVLALALLAPFHASAQKITAWGDNTFGQVSGVPAGTDFIGIAGSYLTGISLNATGHINAWGYNGYGQVSGAPTGAGFTAVSGGNTT
jgi:hypothetical protein